MNVYDSEFCPTPSRQKTEVSNALLALKWDVQASNHIYMCLVLPA